MLGMELKTSKVQFLGFYFSDMEDEGCQCKKKKKEKKKTHLGQNQ